MEIQLFRVNRPMMLAGRQLQAGEVVDLSKLALPPGRALQMVQQRRGEFVQSSESTPSDLALAALPDVVPTPSDSDAWDRMGRDELVVLAREAGMTVRSNQAAETLRTKLREAAATAELDEAGWDQDLSQPWD